jgi:ATP-dependent DNA ligase
LAGREKILMILQPMKPAKLDLDKDLHKRRLDEYMSSPNYVAEPKIDGCHYFLNGGVVQSTQISKSTGTLVDKTGNFPHLVEAFLKANLGDAVLDGEINFAGNQKSYDVTKITGCSAEEAVRRQENETGWVSYTVFDILRDPKGNWLYNQPWYKRREILEYVMSLLTKECPQFELIPVRRSRKQKFLDDILNRGGEGIVLKHTAGIYLPGKRPIDNWVKIKVSDTDDVVVMGFDPPQKEYTGKNYEGWPYWEDGIPVTKNYYNHQIGSIVFGKYDSNHELVFLGTCTGINDDLRKEFTDNPEKYLGKVMEIKFMEKTPDNRHRHPNFVRIHSDKNPYECII